MHRGVLLRIALCHVIVLCPSAAARDAGKHERCKEDDAKMALRE
jgi:hypothetical protein